MVSSKRDMGGVGKGPPRVVWQERLGKHVSVLAPEGSSVAQRLGVELRRADVAADFLFRLVGPGKGAVSAKPAIYLVDGPVVDDSALLDGEMSEASDGAKNPMLIRVLQPDAAEKPWLSALTIALVRCWYGVEVDADNVVIRGLAGMAGAGAGLGFGARDADARVQAELAAGKRVSLLEGDQSVLDAAAVSFTSYLADTYGKDALPGLIRSHDPARPDKAFQVAFQQPLGVLEASWLAAMKRRRPGSSPLGVLSKRLLPLLRSSRWRFAEIFVYMLLGLTYSLTIPLAAKYLTDRIIPTGSVRRLVLFALVLAGIYAVNALATYRRNIVSGWVSQTLVKDMRQRMFEHVQKLPHEFYHRTKIGDLMERFSTDLDSVSTIVMLMVNTVAYQIMVVAAVSVTLIVLSPVLACLVLLILPIFALSFLALRSRSARFSREAQGRQAEMASQLHDSISAHAVIKAFSMSGRAASAYRMRLQALRESSMRLNSAGAVMELSFMLAVAMGQAIILGAGGYMVMRHQMTIGTFIAFFGLSGFLFGPVALISNAWRSVAGSSGSICRVEELLAEPVSVADAEDALDMPAMSESIRLDDVSFSYEEGRQVLGNVSLTISRGARVAFVGPSGSGKSTFANILLRFWDPDSGSVSVDGVDLRRVKLDSLRGQIGVVLQETFLFDTTIRENVSIGKPDATDAEIIETLRLVGLESFLEDQPNGLDSVVGERGVRMSGGQKQRLAIARVLVKKPSILIMDEATSALDAHTESLILANLPLMAPDVTLVSITHRLAWAARADKVFLLDGGELVEQGSHEELMAKDGLYKRLYDEQVKQAVPWGASSLAANLGKIPLFADLGVPELRALGERFTLEHYDANQVIVAQGEPGDRFCVVESGQVEVVLGTGATSQRLSVLGSGEFFGEMALLSEHPRSANVIAMRPTTVFSLARTDFLTLLESREPIREAVEGVMAARQRTLESVIHGGSKV